MSVSDVVPMFIEKKEGKNEGRKESKERRMKMMYFYYKGFRVAKTIYSLEFSICMSKSSVAKNERRVRE